MPVTYYDNGNLHIGTLSDYLEHIETRFKTPEMWGEALRTGKGSQSRKHATIMAELVSDLAALLGYIAAQNNPDTSNGSALHEQVGFNGIEVDPNRPTTVTLECLGGSEGATIPAGKLVSAGGTNQCSIDSETIVPPNDVVLTSATAVEEGPIVIPAGTLTTIDTPVYGWEGVTNPLDAVVGSYEESDPALKARRRDAARGVGGGSGPYIETRLRNLDTVTDVSIVFDQAKHLHAVVEGGTSEEIAQELHRSVAGGTIYEGTTSVEHTDPETGQVDTVRYYSAVEKPVYIIIEVERLEGYTNAGGDELIKERVVDYFSGGLEVEGIYLPRPRLGETLTAGKVSLGADTVDHCHVRRTLIGFDPNPGSSEDLSMEKWWRASTSAALITVREYTP